MVCEHRLVTLSLTVNETLKWLSSPPILMQESFWWWHWQCSNTNRYIISIFPHLHPSFPLLPVANSLMVSVDVKHRVYLHYGQSPWMIWTGRWSWAVIVSWTVLCFKFQHLVDRTLSLWLCFTQLFRLKEQVCKVHKLFRTGEVITTLISYLLVWWRLRVSLICGLDCLGWAAHR